MADFVACVFRLFREDAQSQSRDRRRHRRRRGRRVGLVLGSFVRENDKSLFNLAFWSARGRVRPLRMLLAGGGGGGSYSNVPMKVL